MLTKETPLAPASVTASASSAIFPGMKLRQFFPAIGFTPSANVFAGSKPRTAPTFSEFSRQTRAISENLF